MATDGKNLSALTGLPAASNDWSIGIVCSEWNDEITNGLKTGAQEALRAAGVDPDQVYELMVPGAYELPLGAQWVIERFDVDAVICLGSVIRGETSHFDFVCQGASAGIMEVGLTYNLPVIFGVLTDDHIEQSRARSGGKHGNKGTEAAVTALRMLALRDDLNKA